VREVGYEGMHAQKQTQPSTRLKGKQEDCSIKEVGGKRVRIQSGERYVVKVTQERKLTQLQQVWRMGSVVGVKSHTKR
jgi:2-C-methyl-D-erythritol 4-phosphate cytidylyltransferase